MTDLEFTGDGLYLVDHTPGVDRSHVYKCVKGLVTCLESTSDMPRIDK